MPKLNLPKPHGTLPRVPFMWKDRRNNFYLPSEMKTRHVFFTLRMIWNHSAPPHMRFMPYQRYDFSPFYTSDYMSTAVKVLSAELKTREDLTDEMKITLSKMSSFINDIQLKELPQHDVPKS